MMLLTDQIKTLALTFADATGLALTVVSNRACGDHRVLPRLITDEASLTLARADRAIAWFSAHWPDGAVWPAEVPRPAVIDEVTV